MMAQTLEERRAYAKRYREANKDKIRAAQQRWSAENPEKSGERSRRHYKANRVRLLERTREWQKNNPDKVRASGRRCRGLPPPSRPVPGTCECCGRPPGKTALCLDHCHTSNQFRGWLCAGCNKALGSLGDSIEGLMKAVHYLQRAAGEVHE